MDGRRYVCCLIQTDNSSFCLACADKENVGLSALALGVFQSVNKELVGRDNGNTSPKDKVSACDVCSNRRNASLGAFSLKCSDSSRVSKEEGRFFPYLCYKLVKVVGSGRTVSRLNALRVGNVFQQTVIIVVDKLALLTFTKALDSKIKLLLDLIVG